MGYGIVRCAKVSGASSGGGAYIHNERKKDKSNTNPDIDFSKTKDNYSIGSYDESMTYNQRAEKRIEEGYTGKKAIRKDAVKMVEFLFAYTDDGTVKDYKAYYQQCYDWLCYRYGKDNIIADKVHLDEKTPHMHAVIVPLTEDGRLSCKEVIGGPKQLQTMQNHFYYNVSKGFGLERGEKADLDNPDRIPKKHIPTMEYKRYTEYKLDQKITDKEKKVKSLDFKEKSQTNKLNALNNILDTVQEEYQEVSEKLSEAQKEKEKIEDSISDLQGEEKQLEDDITELIDKYERLEKAPPKIKEKLVEKIVPVVVEKEVEKVVEVPKEVIVEKEVEKVVEINRDYKEESDYYFNKYQGALYDILDLDDETYENVMNSVSEELQEDVENLEQQLRNRGLSR